MALAAAIGFGAALSLIYMVLKKYTYPAVEQPFFSDPSFFKLFTVGLIAGTGIFVGYTFFQPWWPEIFIAAAFAFVFEFAKLIVINLKRFHGKSDTVFYGFGLGVGAGCAFAFGFVFYASTWTIELLGTADAASWIFFALISVQTVMVHSATGMTIGEGIARRRPFEFLVQALIISVAYQLLVSQLWAGHGDAMTYVFLALSLVLAAGYFYHTVYMKLPRMIKEMQREEGRGRKEMPR
jgi:hypothetical protein